MLKKLTIKINRYSRGEKRLLKAGLTGISGILFRFLTMSMGFISIPLTAKYLGTERFGFFLILSSLLTWVGISDFGLSNSLKNILAKADGEQDIEQAKVAVSSTFYLTIGLSALILVIFFLINPLISWSEIFKLTSSLAKDDARNTIIVVFLIFLSRLSCSIISNIYAAYQEQYIYNFWVSFASIGSFFLLVTAISFKASLTVLVAAFFGTSLLGDLISGIHLFFKNKPWLKPKLSYFQWNDACSLLKLGLQFWIVQIAAIILYQTDLILVSQMFSLVEVAEYGVTLKLFSLANSIQVSFLAPLWPAYVESLARKDFNWATTTFTRSLLFSIGWTSATSFGLIIFGQKIVELLVNSETKPSLDLLFTMALTTILMGVSQVLGMFLNGLGEVRSQAIIGLPSGVFNLVTSIILGRLLGVAGITLGTAITFIMNILIFGIITRKKLKSLQLLTNIE